MIHIYNCADCHHPQYQHKDGAGMCTCSDTVTKVTVDGGETMGIKSKGVPCHCNLFRMTPTLAAQTESHCGACKHRESPEECSSVACPQKPSIALTCGDCPIGGRTGDGPVCPNVDRCDREAEEFTAAMDAERSLLASERPPVEKYELGEVDPMDLVPREFIMAMGMRLRDGIKDGREAGDWKDLKHGPAWQKRMNLEVHVEAGEYDSAACNALILWWHFQRAQDADTLTHSNGVAKAPTT